MEGIVVRQGEVLRIEGYGVDAAMGTGGLRVLVKLYVDKDEERINGDKIENEVAYAYPLLPRTLQSIPKIGEGVLVITSHLGDKDSQRYYIGPLLSQPQFWEYEKYYGGRGTANALTDSRQTDPIESIDKNPETKGAFPSPNDVAIIGRGGSDIIIRDPKPSVAAGSLDFVDTEQIALRCGIRLANTQNPNINEQGKINFNTSDPTYIQMLYAQGLFWGDTNLYPTTMGNIGRKQPSTFNNGAINIVADKINLMSHNDFPSNINLATQPELITEEDLQHAIDNLHNMVYGDVLIKYLELLRSAIVEHTHPFPMLPPIIQNTKLQEVVSTDLSQMVSSNIRLS